MRDHLSADELAWYVGDGLRLAARGWEHDRIAALEAHLDTCDACAARLAGEARLELAMEAVARDAGRRAGAGAWLTAGLAAIALLVVLAVGRGSVRGDPSPAAGPPADAGVIELAMDGDVPAGP